MSIVRSRVWVLGALLSLAAGLTVLAAPAAQAAVLVNVPADQPTIQAGIDAATNGGAVVVAPGTYFEHVDFKGKAIEVRSEAGPQQTTIDGGGTSHVVVFRSGEGRSSVLTGFTITHGTVPTQGGLGLPYGAGVAIANSSPTIRGNIITDNDAGGAAGGGVGAIGGAPLILDNFISGNRTSSVGGGGGIIVNGQAEVVQNAVEQNTAGGGGGIAVSGGTPIVRNNFLWANHAGAFNGGGLTVEGPAGQYINNVILQNTSDSAGGGVYLSEEGGAPYLLNNTIVLNEAPVGAGVAIDEGAPIFANNLIAGAATQPAVWCRPGLVAVPEFSHNDVYNGTASPYSGCADPTGTSGNISADPLLNSDGPRYVPNLGSPAIDAGDNQAASLPTTDLYGKPRITDGDGDAQAVVDLGAVEQPQVPITGVGFHPLPPARILDTRLGIGAPTGKLGAAAGMALQVTGKGGVPSSGVSAVVLNVTVTDPTSTSWLTAYPAGTFRPSASNLNFVAGQTVPNLVVVKVGDGGKVVLYNSEGATHVIADVAGWYGDVDGGARYQSLTPARILDTRTGGGAPTAKVGPGATLALQVTGQGGVPAGGVSAVVMNVTVNDPTASGWLTAWPAGTARPVASNLNFVAGQTVPNLVVVKVGEGGKVNLFNSAGSTHVIADVAGWFGADGAPGGAGYVPVAPRRLLDTRTGLGGYPAAPLGPGATLELDVSNVSGDAPVGPVAVVLNVTVVGPTAEGWLTAWPTGAPRPLASNLNFVPGVIVPNLVMVKVGESGKVSLDNSSGSTHVVVDAAGWYAQT